MCSALSSPGVIEQSLFRSKGRRRDFFKALRESTPFNVSGIDRLRADFRLPTSASIGFLGDSVVRELSDAFSEIAPNATVTYYPEPLVSLSRFKMTRQSGARTALSDLSKCSLDALFIGGYGQWHAMKKFFTTRGDAYRQHAQFISPELDRIDCLARASRLPIVFIGMMPADAEIHFLPNSKEPTADYYNKVSDQALPLVWARVERMLFGGTRYDANMHLLYVVEIAQRCPGIRCDGSHFASSWASDVCHPTLSVWFPWLAEFTERLNIDDGEAVLQRRRECLAARTHDPSLVWKLPLPNGKEKAVHNVGMISCLNTSFGGEERNPFRIFANDAIVEDTRARTELDVDAWREAQEARITTQRGAEAE